MTYEEFKKLINDAGKYYADKEPGGITIRTAKEYEIAWISNTQIYTLNTNYWTTYEDKSFLNENWDIISEYIETPIKDRKVDHEEVFLNVKEHNNIIHNIQSCIDAFNEGLYPEDCELLLEGIKNAVGKLRIKQEDK